MTSFPELSAIVASAALAKQMRSCADVGGRNWIFWERRTVNIHRVVGLLRTEQPFADVRALDAELRGVLARNFTRAWWRGIGYGIVARIPPLAASPDQLQILVDGRENPKGTMQWVILADGESREVTAVHTWMEGFLSPVYRSVLSGLQARGLKISSVRKEKDGLMRVLTAVADGRAMAMTGRQAFPDFRDPFAKGKPAQASRRSP
jgi:hypothetical protein